MTKVQRVSSLGNSILVGLAGGAVLGSSFGVMVTIASSIIGGVIGGIARNQMDGHRFTRHTDKPKGVQREKKKRHFVN